MAHQTLDTASQRPPAGKDKGTPMQRFKRFCGKPRNRAGLATAVLSMPLLLVFAITHGHYTAVAIDVIPSFIAAFLLGRALKVEPGDARSDEVGMLAYMPLGVAAITFMLVPALLANVGKQPPHTFDSFYTAASAVLAALLIALMIESRSLLHVDPQLQALRSWWIACVVIGVIAALSGLTPDLSRIARETAFQATWAGVAGAITAGTLVMSRDYLAQLAERTRYTPGVDDDRDADFDTLPAD